MRWPALRAALQNNGGPALQPATKTAGKNKGGPALQRRASPPEAGKPSVY